MGHDPAGVLGARITIMPTFIYKALSSDGTAVRGRVDAASCELLTRELGAQGMLVQEVRPVSSSVAGFSVGRNRAKPEEVLSLAQEMVTLLRAGLTLPDTLDQLKDRPGQPALETALGRVLERINQGVALSAACERESDIFDILFISALRVGERTGAIDEALRSYCSHAERSIALRRRFSQAMAYPVFLLLTLAVVLILLFVFVLPRFVELYANLGTGLPAPTRAVIYLVDSMPYWMPAMIILWLGLQFSYRRFVATAAGRLAADRAISHIPLYGPARHTVSVIHAARALGAFLTAGTPLVEAMQAVGHALADKSHAERMLQAASRVGEGSSLAAAAKEVALFPDKALKLIGVGEASGALDEIMIKIAEFYEMQLDHQMSRIVSIIEPALMLLVGVFIGGIIVVMYLPVFGMAEIIR